MYKNTGANATAAGEFTDGDVQAGVPRSLLVSAWTNMVQRELQAIPLQAGIALDQDDEKQLMQSIALHVTDLSALAGLPIPDVPAGRTVLVYVHGANAAGDGGAGAFRWVYNDNTDDDGGTVITPDSAPASGRWKRIFERHVNVRWFGPVADGVADDAPAFQAASDAAAGLPIVVPDGSYVWQSPVTTRSSLIGIGKPVITRGADIDNMLRNVTGAADGYAGDADITVMNIVFDGNRLVFPGACTLVAYGHAQRIRIAHCELRSIPIWHALELNAVRDVTVAFNRFYDNGGTGTTEFAQIDLMAGAAQFPWFGNYDNTPCDNVTFIGNDFEAGVDGIGSHSAVAGQTHSNIKLIGNNFRDMSGQCIKGLNWSGVTEYGNTFDDVEMGSTYEASVTDSLGLSISGNTYRNVNKSVNSRAIWVLSKADKSIQVRNISVQGNVIDTIGRHGIGIDYCAGVTVTGNVVRNCQQSGIWIFQCDTFSVTGNTSTGNGSVSGYDVNVGFTGSADTTDGAVTGNTCGILNIADGVDNLLAANNNVLTDLIVSVGATNVRTDNNGQVSSATDRFLRKTATLQFPSTAAGGFSDINVSVPGAAPGDPVAVGARGAIFDASNTMLFGFVTTTDTVTVRFLNQSAGALDPAETDFSIVVSKY